MNGKGFKQQTSPQRRKPTGTVGRVPEITIRNYYVLLVCLALTGCLADRQYKGYRLVDTTGDNFALLNTSGLVLGPSITNWNVWRNYIFLKKVAGPEDFNSYPHTSDVGLAILHTGTGKLSFYKNASDYERQLNSLAVPTKYRALHRVVGKWRPDTEPLGERPRQALDTKPESEPEPFLQKL